MKAVVTGGSGFVGSELLSFFAKKAVVARPLSRSEVESPSADVLKGVDLFIHLAGEPITEGRWDEDKKKKIRDSRIMTSRKWVEVFSKQDRPIHLISASAIGFYGDRGDEELTEVSPPGDDFLGKVCIDWESEIAKWRHSTSLRIGIVLGKEGGILSKMVPLFRKGLGGAIGPGTNWMSWIQVEDLARIIWHCFEKKIYGVVNAVSPNPVVQKDFAHALASTVHRPSLLKVPKMAVKLALGEASQVVLASQKVKPTRLIETKFEYLYPELQGALEKSLAN